VRDYAHRPHRRQRPRLSAIRVATWAQTNARHITSGCRVTSLVVSRSQSRT